MNSYLNNRTITYFFFLYFNFTLMKKIFRETNKKFIEGVCINFKRNKSFLIYFEFFYLLAIKFFRNQFLGLISLKIPIG